GFRTDTLGGVKSRLEQPVEVGPRRAGLNRDAVKRFQLTKDLGLSQNHRVERAGNPEDMPDGLIIVVTVKLPGEVLAGQTAGFAQERFESLQSFRLFFNPGKKFDSIACGEDYHL